jgi:hypothetical protein
VQQRNVVDVRGFRNLYQVGDFGEVSVPFLKDFGSARDGSCGMDGVSGF